MAEPRLHLDADTSVKTLQLALMARGHDVTRTPSESLPVDASDERQLLWASARGRILFSFNIRDFAALARMWPDHHGILVAAQGRWNLADLIAALDRCLSETESDEWKGQFRWLNEWRR